MKPKLRMSTIHQTATSLERTNNLNPKTKRYPALDESNQMKSTYCTIHPGKNPPPQSGCRLKSVDFLKVPVSHSPLSQFNRTFHKTNCQYTKYQFSLDIAACVLPTCSQDIEEECLLGSGHSSAVERMRVLWPH